MPNVDLELRKVDVLLTEGQLAVAAEKLKVLAGPYLSKPQSMPANIQERFLKLKLILDATR